MGLARTLALLQTFPRYQRLLEEVRAPLPQPVPSEANPTLWSLGLVEAARPYVAAALQADWPEPIVVLCDKPESARRMVEQIRAWSPDPDQVRYFHAPDAIFYDRVSWDPDTTNARLSTLATLVALRDRRGEDFNRRMVIVTSVWALLAKSVPPVAFRRATRYVGIGDVIAPLRFLEQSVRTGYRPVAVVEEPGSFCQRGGIIDIFPPNHSEPLRIEFFGDQIDTIRTFDPATQRSQAHIQKAWIAPASEALSEWGQAAAEALRRLDLSACTRAEKERIQEECERLARGEHFVGIEYYLPYLYPRPANLFSFLPPQALVLTDDLTSLQEAARGLENQALGMRGDMVAEGRLPREFAPPYFGWDDLQKQMASFCAISLGYGADDAPPFFDELTFTVAPRYGGQISLALDDLVEMRDRQKRVLAVTRQGERLADLLRERNIYVSPSAELTEIPDRGAIAVVDGIIDEGWGFSPQELVIFSDVEIFGWSKPRRRPTSLRRRFAPESFFADLSPGDYVVHAEYGIGRYHGMVKKKLGEIEREYLEIEYAGGDRLYVPIHQASRVSRYLGGDDREPYLHRLGSTEWETVRSRAQRAVRDIAAELLELYAAREVAPGHAFAPDTEWQRELEASFPHEETEDQLSALEQVKADMERPKPMDRLICGDVGYGKTEVALRAAFKAVMDGRQVALLVPTTVLAQQHFYTFRRRLRAFPVTVEMLSRFRSPEEQEEVLEGLRSGKVDIVIGTHRLLSQDVTFKSLGLLIIDEEQRFGVSHKERLKRLRHEVDVLTLTATPIPRTLYMALSGVRDMSVIDTPPEDRLPVRTFVSEYDQAMIRKAILREIDRGGQVYFVHNRVQDIYAVADELQEIVPEVSITIGHGQMDDAQLAQVMLGFAQGEYEVLVCTTIIESGLDIPNVNTIIINNADHLGLAQLYQLRGRVGRGANRAYAYLFFKPPLTDTAHSRLQTIQEATELGAGFRVAMRDLEIRGAGELLGAEQHGHIAAIGFDLYCRLLQQAVDELRQSGEAPRVAMQRAREQLVASALPLDMGPSIDLPLSAYLPEEIMPDTQVRLRFYRRLARIDAMHEVEELASEMTDRFGALPEPVENLLYLMRVRILADEVGVPSINGNTEELVLALALPLTTGAAQQLEAVFPQVRARGSRIWLPAAPQWRTELLALLRHLSTLKLTPLSAPSQENVRETS